MILKKWEQLPTSLQNNSVKQYYDILEKKKLTLVLKRIFDIVCSIILLIILSPIMCFVSIWIKMDSNGPVFYRQVRVTQYNKDFKIYKFRTMVMNADKIGAAVTSKEDCRITNIGKKIRKIRVDELPQLINVLKGEMSFVGTRPEVRKYVDNYTDEMFATLLLPAGITSLASIAFRNEDEKIEECKIEIDNIDRIYLEKILPLKMEYNFQYLRTVSFRKDIVICIRTII